MTYLVVRNIERLELSQPPNPQDLEKPLRQVAFAFGDESPAMVQALTDTSAFLVMKDHPTTALPFVERALVLSRRVYGLDHRETAFALNDLAVVITNIASRKSSTRAIELLRDAYRIRLGVLGPNHVETAGGLAFLAEQLMLAAATVSDDAERRPLLVEAEKFALSAKQVLSAAGDQSHSATLSRILIECALANEDYVSAEFLARESVRDSMLQADGILYPQDSAQDLLSMAIRGQRSEPNQ